jgi:hypothetical protein
MDHSLILWHSLRVAISEYQVKNSSGRGAVVFGLVLSLTLVVSASCRREVSAAEMKEGANTPAASESGSAPASRFDDAAFSLTMEAKGPFAAGKPAAVNVVLTAKGPHHVNQEYPHKLKLKATDGITYPQAVIGRDAMRISNTQAEFSVPLTPSRSGKLTVGGDFAFSLCTADRCLIEKRALALEIQAL